MKSRIFAAFSAAILILSCMTACSGKKESTSESTADSSSPSSSSSEATESVSETEPEVKEGPVFSIENVEAKAGETVEVSVSLSGAEGKWAMCGVHMTYDNRLECIAIPEDPMTPECVKGEAVLDMMAFVTMIWTDNLDQELVDAGKGCLFFTTMGNGDCGKDGIIATYKFKVPDDAQAGEVYELGFYYREGDMFVNAANDNPELQEQAFSNWESGSVTVV